MRARTDYTGQRFGRLTAMRYVDSDVNSCQRWLMRCDCGTEFIAHIANCKAGKTRSCGCLRSEETAERNRTR